MTKKNRVGDSGSGPNDNDRQTRTAAPAMMTAGLWIEAYTPA